MKHLSLLFTYLLLSIAAAAQDPGKDYIFFKNETSVLSPDILAVDSANIYFTKANDITVYKAPLSSLKYYVGSYRTIDQSGHVSEGKNSGLVLKVVGGSLIAIGSTVLLFTTGKKAETVDDIDRIQTEVQIGHGINVLGALLMVTGFGLETASKARCA